MWRLTLGNGKKKQDLTEELKEMNPLLSREIDEAVRFMAGVDDGERIEQEEALEAIPFD
jgi:hypothetical protein